MNTIIVAPRTPDWRRLKALVLDSVSSPITKRVYNLGLDAVFEWYGQEPRPGFTKATVSAWRVALEARGLGSVEAAQLGQVWIQNYPRERTAHNRLAYAYDQLGQLESSLSEMQQARRLGWR